MKTTISVIKADVGSPAMLPYSELEYGGIVEKLKALEPRFTVRGDTSTTGKRAAS